MDDIGNLAYIIVFIIWFLYRTFGKGSKKASKPKPTNQDQTTRPEPGSGPTEATPPPITFEDILRELTGAPAAPPQEEPRPMTYDEPHPFDADYYPEEEESTFEVLRPSEEVVSEPEAQPDLRFKEFDIHRNKSSKAARAAFKAFRSRQGARQAFIMKEIFDRKY
jgi:hypothetical protein